MLIHRLLLAIALAGFSQAALADGQKAAQALYSNLQLAGKKLRVDEQNAYVTRTLVRGMYALVDAKGKFVTFLNEDGDLYGDKHGLFVFPKRGAPPVPMTPQQLAAYRAEVINAVERSALIRIVKGDGAERENTLLLSAIDCPACYTLERNLAQSGRKQTFYLAPSSITVSEDDGWEEWQKVARIWCAKDPAQAWRNYMDKQALPLARKCAFSDPRVAEAAYIWLFSILRNSGMPLTGVPSFVYADGSVGVGANATRRWPAPAPSVVTARWLPSPLGQNSSTVLAIDTFRPRPVRGRR